MIKIRDKCVRAFQRFSAGSFVAGVLCAVCIAALCFLIWLFLPWTSAPSRPDSFAAMRKVNEVEGIIRRKYIDQIDETEQTDAMLRGLTEGLNDPYADYYTKEEYEELKEEHAGLTKGIGIQIASDTETGDLIVLYVMPDTPAEQAGVLENDRILSVNGIPMTGRLPAEAAEIIQASERTVTLTLCHEGEEEPVELVMEPKAVIQGQAVSAGMVDDRIGYIRIYTFNKLTAEQFEEYYAELKEKGMTSLIIDLRNNLGGLVSACCDTLDQILPEGPIVFEQERTGKEKHQDSSGRTPIDMPLVLLVNGYTASASEIFTGAVRDYGLATIVGEQTYGKGVEQNTYELADGSALKLTTAVYYTPSHQDINGTGITPDIYVPLTEEDETDVQFERAVKILSGKMPEKTEQDRADDE